MSGISAYQRTTTYVNQRLGSSGGSGHMHSGTQRRSAGSTFPGEGGDGGGGEWWGLVRETLAQCCDSIETSDIITVTRPFCSVSAPYLWPDIEPPPQLRDCHGSTLASLGVRTERRAEHTDLFFQCVSGQAFSHVMSRFWSKGKKGFPARRTPIERAKQPPTSSSASKIQDA